MSLATYRLYISEGADPNRRYRMYNGDEIRDAILVGPTVAYICGHYHKGGHFCDKDGVHHITPDGVVEANAPACHGVVRLDHDSLRVEAAGALTAQVLQLRPLRM